MNARKAAAQARSRSIRTIHVKPDRGEVVSLCLSDKIGIKSVDLLPDDATKITCRTVAGAKTLRARLARRPSQRRVHRSFS